MEWITTLYDTPPALPITRMALSPDGNWLVLGFRKQSEYSMVRMINARTGAFHWSKKLPGGQPTIPNIVSLIAHREYAIVADSWHRLHFLILENGRARFESMEYGERITAIALAKDGSALAISGQFGSLSVLALPPRTAPARIASLPEAATALTWGKALHIGTASGTIGTWKGSGEIDMEPVQSDTVTALLEVGPRLYSTSEDKTLYVQENEVWKTKGRHQHLITGLALLGSAIVTCGLGEDDTLRIRRDDHERAFGIDTGLSLIRWLAAHPDGRHLYIATEQWVKVIEPASEFTR